MKGLTYSVRSALKLNETLRFLTYDTSLPRITISHRMQLNIDKARQKKHAKEHQKKRHYKGPLLISCKRKEFNHFKGQTYVDFGKKDLASQGWLHQKSCGDHFTIKPYSKFVQEETPSVTDFSELGVSEEFVDRLNEKQIHTPSIIQRLTIPAVFSGQNVMCIAETGSGKTLCYVLHILQRIQQLKHAYRYLPETMNAPFAVVLVPSRELAAQITDVFKSLSPEDCAIKCIIGGAGTQKLLRWKPVDKTDVLITTPGVFSKLLTNKIYNTSLLQNIVLDEADTLLDGSFQDLTKRIITKMKIATEKLDVDGETLNTGTQVMFVGATLPSATKSFLSSIVPMETVNVIKTPFIHKISPNVHHTFMRMKPSQKTEMLLKAVQRSHLKKIPTIVFCNTSESCMFLSHFLEENNVPCTVFHSKMTQNSRDGRFQRFQDGEVNILVSTDIASRGLDTIRAQHVYNFDFPNYISDYIHRSGRVGRLGSQVSSVCISFVVHKWEVEMVNNIEASIRRSIELQDVNADIQKQIEDRHEKKIESLPV